MGVVVTFTGFTPPPRYDTVPWTQALIEEAASSTGTWATIDTVTFDVPDADPSVPGERSFTTENGTSTSLWYRVSFLDDDGNQSTTTTPAQNAEPDSTTMFASPDDLAERLGITMTEDEEERAEGLLVKASALIQQAVGQTIALVTDDELVRPGSYSDRLRLPQRPVVEVASITAALLGGDPVDIPDTSWYLDGDELVRVNLLGIISERFFGFSGRGWLAPTFSLTITYTHGYDTIPGLVKAICLEAVTRVWTNPGVVREEAYGSSQITYQKSSGLLLTDDERRQLNDVFRRTSGSVALR